MIASKFRSVCVIGADGAGKTTISEAIADEISYNGESYQYWWCGWREFQSFPFRMIRKAVRSLFSGNSSSSRDQEVNTAPQEPGIVEKVIGLVYFPFVFIDHYITTAPKALLLAIRDQPVVYDRYYYGMIIGFCSYYSYSDRLIRMLLSLSILYPSPDRILYLDIDPESAYERKDDVPSPKYIEKRRDRYKSVINRSDTVTIDAGQSIEKVKQDAFDALDGEDQ